MELSERDKFEAAHVASMATSAAEFCESRGRGENDQLFMELAATLNALASFCKHMSED